MKLKRILACLTMMTCMFTLSGCGSNTKEVAELRNIKALNAESELTNVNMSISEKEAAVYAQVSNRTLLDLSSLTSVPASDRDAVVAYMDSVDAQLCGSLNADDGVIDESYTNYLLMEFEKTPYHWQRSSMNIRGMDPASRSVVIDVDYSTIGYNKVVQDPSYIVKGEPNFVTLEQVRYDRWLEILEAKHGFNNLDPEEIKALEEKFEKAYGKPEDIIDSQRNLSLTDTVYETGTQKTYTGLIDHEQEQSGAKMTVRFVLVPQYALGINQGYSCQHMYVLNYQVDNDTTEGRTLYSEEDSSVIADNVYNTLFRYYKCLDEDNFIGLNSLVNGFKNFDKHFEDYFETTYRKYDSFTLSVFNISGTTIECGATVSRKVRAKGSNMTFPIYTDRYYYVIELIDGRLQIVQEVLLSSTLEGEPAINTETIDTTGFTSSISLTNTDKKEIETLIANFGAQQLLNDSASDGFSDLVDMSLSASQLSVLKDNMLSVTGKTKASWIISYLQGHQNYASVKCKELVQAEDGGISELTVTYDFIYKGGKWVIYDYQILSRAKLDTTEFTTQNALCVVTAGSVDSLVSQVAGSVAEGEEGEATQGTDNIGEVITYKEYTPVPKQKGEAEANEPTEEPTGEPVEGLTSPSQAGVSEPDGSVAIQSDDEESGVVVVES